MIHRDKLIGYTDEFLHIDTFNDVCRNGIQVEGKEDISSVVTAVSASERLFAAAIDLDADLIIVHHGLFWKGTPHPFALKGVMRRRIKQLLDHDINLAAYHLPLDAHPIVGNNIQLIKQLSLENPQEVDVGYWGICKEPRTIHDMQNQMKVIGLTPMLFLSYGPEFIHRVAIVSGGASSMIERMTALNADLFISGDTAEPVVRLAEELGIHYCALGHYNSEKLGPIALGNHLSDEFKIPVQFIDIPCPV